MESEDTLVRRTVSSSVRSVYFFHPDVVINRTTVRKGNELRSIRGHVRPSWKFLLHMRRYASDRMKLLIFINEDLFARFPIFKRFNHGQRR